MTFDKLWSLETTEVQQAMLKATMVTIRPLTCTVSTHQATDQPVAVIDAHYTKRYLADLAVAKSQAAEATRTEAPTVSIHTVVIQSQHQPANTMAPVPREPAPNLPRNKASTTSSISKGLHLHAPRSATVPDLNPAPGPSAPGLQLLHLRTKHPPPPHLNQERAQRTHNPYIPVLLAVPVEPCPQRLLAPNYKRSWAKSENKQPL